jgi:hypothetical protein
MGAALGLGLAALVKHDPLGRTQSFFAGFH